MTEKIKKKGNYNFFLSSEENRQRGRTMRKWDNNKMDIREIRSEGDKIKWWALLQK
jgi:hypothetical protein